MKRAAATVTPAEVLAFWFGSTDPADPRWFKRSGLRRRDARASAPGGVGLAGRLAGWAAQPPGALALIVVLDQFTRNIHRGTPAAFAGDAQALALALQLVERGAHLRLPPLQRWFAYLPLEHAEDMALQQQCVRLFEALAAAGSPTARRWQGRWTMRGAP